jgi:Tfp pilus assembly protein PilX
MFLCLNAYMFKCLNEKDNGSILIFTIVIMFIFSMALVGILGYAAMELRVTRSTIYDQQAFQIAEAGANYYEWHLANFQNDFWDGNASTTPGPYVHNYADSDGGQIIGKFSLAITPPTVGSTIVTVQSTGFALANPKEQRSVTVRYGIPSLAQYAFLTNSDAWIGPSESVSGQFMTNGGLRFDGTGNAAIMSAKSTYNCKSWSGSPCPHSENGIWGSAPQSTQNFWQFPVPNVDFSSMTADLATLKSNAQSAGIYLGSSGRSGYSLVFKSNGTIDFYKVISLNNDPNGSDINRNPVNQSVDYLASSGRTFLYNKPIPANGVIYIEDDTWVEGVVKGRAIVAAAVLPHSVATDPNIIVQNNLTYAARDGTNSLGLLAQGNFLIGYTAPDSLEIDAAIIAQNGSAEIYNWPNNINSLITIYGSTASFGQWTWTYVDGNGHTTSGYANTNTIYDANLLYSPPPSFPLSASGYQQISWSSN